MVKDVQEMKTSLQYTKKDVEDLKLIHVKLEGVNKELDKISKDLASCCVLHLTMILKTQFNLNGKTFNIQRFAYSQQQYIYTYSVILKGYRGNNVIRVLFNRTKHQSCTQLYTTITLHNTESVPQRSVYTILNQFHNTSHSQKMEYLENQGRRNNIRVNGIPEADNETWEDAEVKVKRAIKDNLGIEVAIERTHRVERRKTKSGQANQNQPRTIVCRLRYWKQKEQVLRKARRKKPTDLYISEDLSPATLQKREPQIPKLKAAKQVGKIAYFVLDRFVIRDKLASEEFIILAIL